MVQDGKTDHRTTSRCFSVVANEIASIPPKTSSSLDPVAYWVVSSTCRSSAEGLPPPITRVRDVGGSVARKQCLTRPDEGRPLCPSLVRQLKYAGKTSEHALLLAQVRRSRRDQGVDETIPTWTRLQLLHRRLSNSAEQHLSRKARPVAMDVEALFIQTALERLRTLLGLPIPPDPDDILRRHATLESSYTAWITQNREPSPR